MISNTSETRESIMTTYSIPQLERTLEAIASANKTDDKPNALTGLAAINAMKQMSAKGF